MNKKLRNVLSAFCLAAGLALTLPTISAHIGVSGSMDTVQAADGWGKDENGTYYLKDDKKLTGKQTINDATYYFNSKGYRVTGPVKIDDATYYFRTDNGKLATGLSGLKRFTYDKDIYYYFTSKKNGSISTQKWVTSSKKYFYADKNGQIKLGTISVSGKLYHITSKGRLTSLAKSTYDNKYYGAGSNGVLATGLKKIGNSLYYFDPKTGARQTGLVKVGDKSYYFSKSTGKAATGWVALKDSYSINGKKSYYYYNSSHVQASGFTTIKKKLYYLDPKKGNSRFYGGWKKVGSSYYYANASGVIQTGFFTVDGKTYYSNEKGARQKEWNTIKGRRYFFDKSTGVMKTGWYTTEKKNTFYFNPTKSSSTYGAATTGFKKISGSWYYFSSDGKLYKGWLLDNMKYYYFDPSTGKMFTGKHTIDGKSYNFGTSGAIKADLQGAWSIQVNRKSCFVVVYKGSVAVKAFVCSTARDGVSTPTGNFTLLDKLRWHELNGPSWGQYCSHITYNILFHSVPNMRYNDNHSLNASAFNQLGSPASAGCIRLTVKHAKWLYDNCPIGTKVTINDSIKKPTTVQIETAPKIPVTQNYDPTDPYA